MLSSIMTAVAAKPVTQRTLSWWRSSRLTRAIATMAGGTALAQILSIVTSPVTTRLYGPTDYGMAAVFNSVLGVVLLLATLRYEMAIMLPLEEDKARSILTACLSLAFISSLLAVPITWLFGKWLFTLLGAPGLYRYWWMLPPTICGAALYQCLSVWALRRKDYLGLTKTKVLQAVCGSFVTIGVGCFWKGPFGLLLGAFCWLTLGLRRLGRGTVCWKRRDGDGRVIQSTTHALRNYANFAFLTAGASLFHSAGTLGAPMLFSVCYNQETVGYFSLAQRMVLLPVTLVGTAVAQVFIAEASEMVRERPSELGRFFRQVTGKMTLLALPLLLAGIACPWVFPVVFGERWKTAGIFAALLSISAAAQLIVSPIADISVIRQRQGLQFAIGALRTAVVFATIYLPAHHGKDPVYAVCCYAVGMALMYFVCYFLYLRLARMPDRAIRREPTAA